MIELGKIQELKVVKEASIGVYLGTEEGADERNRILLPKKQVPPEIKIGDVISVFVYRDSDDRLIATIHEPLLTLHQVASLRVKQMTKIGAFLDWGLEKDLLLPFHEQTKNLHEGEEVLVALYVDKSKRLAATMKIYPYLDTASPYQTGDTVEGLIYQYARNFGYFVAVEGRYSGLIPKREAQAGYRVGQTLSFRITRVLEDGKLDLSTHQKAYLQMNVDADEVLKKIDEDFDGLLPFDDKASPEEIREIFGLSKAAFKRAVGHLYKERRVALEEGKIRMLKAVDKS